MSLRVRCPHCKATLVAADEQAGLPGNCSECGQRFIMPLPVSKSPAARTSVAKTCVRCHAELAPETVICPKCATNQVTGQRASLTTRIGRTSFRTWTIAGTVVLLIGLASWIGLETWRNLKRRAESPVAADTPPTASQPVSGGAVERLFAARSAAERKEAVRAITDLGRAGQDGLRTRLGRVSAGERDPQLIYNAARAIDLVADSRDAAGSNVLGVLRELQKNPQLRTDAIRARALLGDVTVSAEAAAEWIDLTRKRMFYERVARLSSSESAGADQAVVVRVAEAADRLAEGLHVLAQIPESTAVSALLEGLFPSWGWLGQQRDERYAAAVWDASKPPRDSDADFKHRVRAARRVLDRTSQSATAGARAAAGIVLAGSGPQYETLRKEIIAALAGQLSECPPVDQQRVTWTLARLAGQRFGDVTDRSTPQDVERTSVLAALEWIRTSGLANPPPLRTARESYPQPPAPSLRVVTPERQLEQELLRALDEGWTRADQAAERWIRAGLGMTPRLNERLDPSQRDPKLCAVAAAILIAAESRAVSARGRLEVWSKATDQPAWLRIFANTALTTLGSGDVGRWLADLSAEGIEFAPDRPSARMWGRLITAGGTEMLERLRKERKTLPAPIRDTLLKAAEQAAARNRKGS